MKKSGYIILTALFASCAGLPLRGFSQDPQADAWAEYNKQAQDEARLKKEAWEKYQKDQDEEAQHKKEAWAAFDEQMNKDRELQDRYEKIISKWEEQAIRFDHVLDAMEKHFGTENDK